MKRYMTKNEIFSLQNNERRRMAAKKLQDQVEMEKKIYDEALAKRKERIRYISDHYMRTPAQKYSKTKLGTSPRKQSTYAYKESARKLTYNYLDVPHTSPQGVVISSKGDLKYRKNSIFTPLCHDINDKSNKSLELHCKKSQDFFLKTLKMQAERQKELYDKHQKHVSIISGKTLEVPQSDNPLIMSADSIESVVSNAHVDKHSGANIPDMTTKISKTAVNQLLKSVNVPSIVANTEQKLYILSQTWQPYNKKIKTAPTSANGGKKFNIEDRTELDYSTKIIPNAMPEIRYVPVSLYENVSDEKLLQDKSSHRHFNRRRSSLNSMQVFYTNQLRNDMIAEESEQDAILQSALVKEMMGEYSFMQRDEKELNTTDEKPPTDSIVKIDSKSADNLSEIEQHKKLTKTVEIINMSEFVPYRCDRNFDVEVVNEDEQNLDMTLATTKTNKIDALTMLKAKDNIKIERSPPNKRLNSKTDIKNKITKVDFGNDVKIDPDITSQGPDRKLSMNSCISETPATLKFEETDWNKTHIRGILRNTNSANIQHSISQTLSANTSEYSMESLESYMPENDNADSCKRHVRFVGVDTDFKYAAHKPVNKTTNQIFNSSPAGKSLGKQVARVTPQLRADPCSNNVKDYVNSNVNNEVFNKLCAFMKPNTTISENKKQAGNIVGGICGKTYQELYQMKKNFQTKQNKLQPTNLMHLKSFQTNKSNCSQTECTLNIDESKLCNKCANLSNSKLKTLENNNCVMQQSHSEDSHSDTRAEQRSGKMIRLDKTPTDEEINQLWYSMKECLSRQTPVLNDGNVGDTRKMTTRPQSCVTRNISQSAVKNKRVQSASSVMRSRSLTSIPLQKKTAYNCIKSSDISPESNKISNNARKLAWKNDVSDSLATFLTAEYLADLGASDTVIENEMDKVIERKHDFTVFTQIPKVQSKLSFDEEKLRQSIDRLDNQLKMTEIKLDPFLVDRECNSKFNGFRGHRPLSAARAASATSPRQHRLSSCLDRKKFCDHVLSKIALGNE